MGSNGRRAKKAAIALAALALLHCVPLPSVQVRQIREERREFPAPRAEAGRGFIDEVREGLSPAVCLPRGMRTLIRK